MRRPVITLRDCLAVLLALLTMQTNQAFASDTTPPLTTASVLMGTYKDAQNIILTCTDGSGSGCASTYYCLGNGCTPTTVYSDPISIAVSTTLKFYSSDLEGNSEPVKTYNYTIDPTLTYQAERHWPQLEQPWYFKAPSGVAVTAGGIVYVADTNNNRIQKFDSNGVFLTQWGSSGSGNSQFNSPKGIAVDSSGNVYVADLSNHRIQKFDSEGTYLTQWGSLGSGNGQFNYIQSVAIDAAGNIFAADFYNNRIQKLDSNGAFMTQWSISYPLSVVVDAGGNVYATDNNNRIQKFDGNGTSLGQFGSYGSGNGQFSNPSGVAIDAGGNVYVTDNVNYRIQKFNSNWSYLTQWGSNGSGSGQFNAPRGVAIDINGFIYVADSGNNRIQKFTTSGAYVSQWGPSGSNAGQLSSPTNAAVDTDGNVYVSDGGNNRIQKFDSSGNYQTQWGSYGSETAQFKTPQGLSWDVEGNVLVADSGNNRIQKFDNNGNYLTQFGIYGEADGQFYGPTCVAAAADGNVYAVDNVTYRVQKFDNSGNFLTKWGSYGSGNGQFSHPRGLAADASGNIYLADNSNKRIQKFNSSGTYQSQWGSAGSGDGQFNNPRSLAVDAIGNVYVADTNNNRIQKFDNNGTYLAQIGTPGSGTGQLLSPTGVAVDGSGNLFVVDANNRVQKFNPPLTLPGAPTGAVAIPGNGQATVSFSAPANNGGKPILSFTVTSTPGDITVSGISPITVTGLTNGISYTFVVTATNAAGVGTASVPSNSIIPGDTIIGVCGNANGGKFSTAPSSNLCAAGIASDVSGNGPWNWICQGTVGGSDASCSANLQSYPLFITKTGAGNLNSNITTDSGILSWHGISGSTSYNSGITVSLNAMADTGSIFTGWSGCDSMNGNACSVTMNSARSVAADFAKVSSCITNAECGTSNYCSKSTGSCGGTGTCTTWNPGGICPAVWLPVCGCNGFTYGNSCEASRSGASIAYSGECSLNSCNAPYLSAPHGSTICWGMDLASEILYINLPKTVIIGGGATFSGINISDGTLEIQGINVR